MINIIKLKLFYTVLYIFTCFSTYGQDLKYAREVINTLCSDDFKGRGYVENGDKKAADFIAGEFRKTGLKKFGKSYFQYFTTPVNSFPGKMSVNINRKELVPGEDFLIEAGSPGISGKFQTEILTADDLLQDKVWVNKLKSSTEKFIVISAFDKGNYTSDQQKRITEIIGYLKFNQENPAKGLIIFTNDKLTWSGSTEVHSKPAFIVKAVAVSGAPETIDVAVEHKFLKSHRSQNVIGYIEGEQKDEYLVMTAHYDHLGMMGAKTFFPGANDNASGVALLLDLARYYSKTKPKYSMVFIAFAGEEIGLVGSKYFTENPLFELKKINFLLNYDIAGTGDDGIQIVNGKVHQDKFDIFTKINEEQKLVNQIKIRGEACNSDHCMFHLKGVPSFFIYTLGGIQAYHDIYDKAETLPLTDYEDYFKLLTEFVKEL
jgi:aminopeptidase YwaD